MVDTSLPDMNKNREYLFKELLGDTIDPNVLVTVYENVKQKIITTSTYIKETVNDNSEVDDWEMKTSLPFLFETYSSLYQIKKNVEKILMDPKISSSKRIKFSQTEKILFAAYVAQIEIHKKELRNTFGIFIDSMEYC